MSRLPKNQCLSRRIVFFLLAAFGLAWGFSAVVGQDETIPKVLIIGDSVQRAFASAAGKELKGKVQFVTSQNKTSSSTEAVADLENLFKTDEWDLIVFNFGLADLIYRDPKSEQIRILSKSAGGVRMTSVADYEKNLEQIVQHLQKTGAKLLWSSTTPIFGPKLLSIYDEGSEVDYNAAAKRVMEKNKIPILGLHAWISADSDNRRSADMLSYNKIPIHEPVVAAISKQLFLN